MKNTNTIIKISNNKKGLYRSIIYRFSAIMLFLMVFLLPSSSASQQAPMWLNEGWRMQSYPSGSFLHEFALDNKSPDESVGEAIERISEIARANLSMSILSTVQSVFESYSQNFEQNGDHQYSEQFTAYSKSESYMVLSGVNVETYYDEDQQMVYAFAFANKYELIGYYKANIRMEVQKIKNIIDDARKYEDELRKVSALEKYESAIPIFADIAFARGLLIAIDNVEGTTYMVEEINELQGSITDALIRLSNAISVFIVSNEDYFGETQNSIKNTIKGILSSENYNFVDSPENAEWILRIDAKAREYNETRGFHFSYIDADISLTRTLANTTIYKDKLSVKGGHVISFPEAARQASNELAETIAEAVVSNID